MDRLMNFFYTDKGAPGGSYDLGEIVCIFDATYSQNDAHWEVQEMR